MHCRRRRAGVATSPKATVTPYRPARRRHHARRQYRHGRGQCRSSGNDPRRPGAVLAAPASRPLPLPSLSSTISHGLRRLMEDRLGDRLPPISALAFSFSSSPSPALSAGLVGRRSWPMHVAPRRRDAVRFAAWRRREPALAERAACRDAIEPPPTPATPSRGPDRAARRPQRVDPEPRRRRRSACHRQPQLCRHRRWSPPPRPPATAVKPSRPRLLVAWLPITTVCCRSSAEVLRRLDRVDARRHRSARAVHRRSYARTHPWHVPDSRSCGSLAVGTGSNRLPSNSRLGWHPVPGNNGADQRECWCATLTSAGVGVLREAGAAMPRWSLDTDMLDDLRSAFDDLHS